MRKRDSLCNYITILQQVRVNFIKIYKVLGMGKIESLQNKTVLEVGSGRGGGLHYIKTYLKAK